MTTRAGLLNTSMNVCPRLNMSVLTVTVVMRAPTVSWNNSVMSGPTERRTPPLLPKETAVVVRGC